MKKLPNIKQDPNSFQVHTGNPTDFSRTRIRLILHTHTKLIEKVFDENAVSTYYSDETMTQKPQNFG